MKNVGILLAVTKFDKGFNVKFPADRLRNRLTLDGHKLPVTQGSR